MGRKQVSSKAKQEVEKAEDRIYELKMDALRRSGAVLDDFQEVSEGSDD